MRSLADMGVSITTVEALRAARHEAVHLRQEGLIRLADCEIAVKAARENEIVIAFYLDFGDILAASRSVEPSVIIFRLRNQTPAAVNPRLFRVIGDCEKELSTGAIIIVEDEGYRYADCPFVIHGRVAPGLECGKPGYTVMRAKFVILVRLGQERRRPKY